MSVPVAHKWDLVFLRHQVGFHLHIRAKVVFQAFLVALRYNVNHDSIRQIGKRGIISWVFPTITCKKSAKWVNTNRIINKMYWNWIKTLKRHLPCNIYCYVLLCGTSQDSKQLIEDSWQELNHHVTFHGMQTLQVKSKGVELQHVLYYMNASKI